MRFRALLLTSLLTLGVSVAKAAPPGKDNSKASPAPEASGRTSPVPVQGRLTGMVVAEGTPQPGAIVVVTPKLRPGGALRLMTNGHGVFATSPLAPGLYSVRVRLAGFLPAFEPSVQVIFGQVTLLRVELGSLFSTVEELRRGPRPGHDPQQWDWVLRSASLTRPVLRYASPGRGSETEAERRAHAPHGRAELTAGSLSSWSPVETQPVGSTSFLYDQRFGETNQLVLAGLAGYEHAASEGFAATWTHSPDANEDATDSTTIVFRQSQMGGEAPAYRGLEIDSMRRLDFGGAELDYGGQYVVAMLDGHVFSLRPEARLTVPLDSLWTATFRLGSNSPARRVDDPLDALDNLPTPVESGGRLALDQAWHEEIALERELGHAAAVTAAVYHDSNAHAAIFGRGPLENADTLADPYSDAFVYNGGAVGSWGARVGYERRLTHRWKAKMLYGWTSALAPGTPSLDAATLAAGIKPERRSLAGGGFAGRLDRAGTEVSAEYEWVSGAVVSQPDAYGAALWGMEPYLNVSLRQPLPSFFCCRIVAIVDVRNLLAQGYVSLETPDGRAVLMSAARAVRGGFAVQF